MRAANNFKLIFSFIFFLTAPSLSRALSLDEQTELYNSYALEAKADYNAASQKLIKIQGTNPENYLINYRLGYLLAILKKYPNALIHYEKAAAAQPQSIEPWLAISLMSFYSKDDTKVISSCKEVLRRDPGNYYGLLRLAGAQIRNKDFAGAAETASSGVRLYPTDATFLEQKSFALKSLGKVDEAKAAAIQLSLIAPTNPFVKSMLAAPAAK